MFCNNCNQQQCCCGDNNLRNTTTIIRGLRGATGPTGPQGPRGEQGLPGQDGLTTEIEVNGQTYTQVSGKITLPDTALILLSLSEFFN